MKKFMSLLLSVLLVMSLVPMMVGAAEKDWNSFVYSQDGPVFSFEATEFTGDNGYKFYAAAYDAAGKLLAVKSTDAVLDDDVLSASVDFEPGNTEANVNIAKVKTMLWDGLTPVVRAGEFAITAQTVTGTVYNSLTNGFYEAIETSNNYRTTWRYLSYDEAQGKEVINPTPFQGTDSYSLNVWSRGQGVLSSDNDVSTGCAHSGTDNARMVTTVLSAKTEVDRVVIYDFEDRQPPRQKGTQYYLTTTFPTPYNSAATTEAQHATQKEQVNNYWTSLAENTKTADVYYLGTSASMAKTATDADAKIVYDVDTANQYQYVVAKKSALAGVGAPVQEMQAYTKVKQQVTVDAYAVANYNVALNAPAFAYGATDGNDMSKAVDGDANTAWVSANTNANYNDYLVLDLGAQYAVTSFDITMAAGSAQNFTIYGSNAAGLANKTALSEKVTNLAEGTGNVASISSDAFRYIIFEQDAAETAFGFKDIKVNSTTQAPARTSTVEKLAYNTGKMWYLNAPGYAQGNKVADEGDYARASIPNMADADPSSVYAINVNNTTHTMIMIDLEEAQKVSHLVYQGRAIDATNNSTGYDHMDNLLIVATNDAQAFNNQNWEVVAEVRDPAAYRTGDGQYDTGLRVFDMSVLGDTPYRYYGIAKTDRTAGTVTHRLVVGTLQAYAQTASEYNVALNAPAFAYGATEGNDMYKAVDDDPNTAWVSANTNANYNDYLVLDLGAQYSVTSFDVTMVAGSGQNFTIYGSNDSGLNSKTPLSAKVSGLTAGTEANIEAISTNSFRYIIFEQDAAETAFGFSDIKVNSATPAPARTSTVGELAYNIGKMWYVNVKGYKQGNACTGAGERDRANIPNMADADPATAYIITEGVANISPAAAMVMIDLEAAKKVSHLVYQGAAADAISGSSGYDHIDNLIVVATNDDNAYLEGGQWTVLGEIKKPSTYVAADNQCDTGLRVFDVASIAGDTAYRYYGIVKTSPYANSYRMRVSTLKVYAPAE